MGTIAITGVGGQIGSLTRRRLEAAGHQVVGIDQRDADVVADLSTAGGRRAMVREVDDACAGSLDGLVVAAEDRGEDPASAVSVNYFGAVACMEGLRPLLEHGGHRGVAVLGAASVTTDHTYSLELAEWCLTGDETRARQAATESTGAYLGTKLALTLWARRASSEPSWAAAGIRINVVCPRRDQPDPITGRMASPAEVAALLAYLISDDGAYFCGSVISMDGGAEAAERPDSWPRPPGH